LRLARRPPLLPLDDLLGRLADLEKRLATGAPPPARGGGSATGSGSSSGSGSSGRSREPAAQMSSVPAVSSVPAAPNPFAGPTFASAPPQQVSAQTSGSLALASPEPEPVVIDVPEALTIVETTPVPPSAVVESSTVEIWRALIAQVRLIKPAIAATFELAAPNVVTRDRIVLGFEPGSFEDGRAEESDARTVLSEVAQAFFNGPAPAVTFDVAKGQRGASVASLDAAKRKAAHAAARAAVENHPLVQKAIAIFDAELKDVRVPAQED